MLDPVSWSLQKVREINNLIWHAPLAEFSKWKALLIRQLRVIVLAARGFNHNKVRLRASALTLYSMLAVVPVAAIAFAIAKGFGLDQMMEEELIKNFKSQQEVLNWLLSNARIALESTKGGYIAGVGIIILFWSVMSLLTHIENSFNQIWQIRIPRPWYRKFTDYITIMLIAPVFIILSSSITVFVNTELTSYMEKAPILDYFKPIISFLLKSVPYILVWFVLTILYIVMPNTKVKFKSALIAGVVTGTILQLLQWFYFDLQFGISKLNTIYGSFAAIPLFMIWLQVSWLFVLLGAELSFANQNVSRYEFESEALNISFFQKKALTLAIMSLIIRNFSKGEPAMTAETISLKLKIPIRLVQDILTNLNSVQLVSMVITDGGKERYYQPAVDINTITVSKVLSRIEKLGIDPKGIIKNKDFEKIEQILARYDKIISKSELNVRLKDL